MNRLVYPAVVLTGLFTGCGPATHSANEDLASQTKPSRPSQMIQFNIGDTEFGIDATTSSFAVDTTDPERPTVTIEIAGDRSTFDPLTVDDDSEWSWALYPPAFYLREFPVRTDLSSGACTAHVTRNDGEDYDVTIYMMEHNDIEEMDVEIVPNKYLAISGRVNLFGDVCDFAIKWEREDAK